MVYPSGAERAAASAAMLPLAPPLFSITTCWPHVSESRAETMRAIASAPPARRERHDQAHEPVGPIRHRQSPLGRSLRGHRAGETWGECRRCGEPDRVAAGDHSLTLMLAAWMTGAHLSISALRCVPSCSDVEPTTTTPSE